MSEGNQTEAKKPKSIYDVFETDESLEAKGIRVRIADSVFIVARAGGSNERFRKVAEAKTRPLRRRIETNTIEAEELNRVMAEIFAESVLLGWENVTQRDGTPLTFSRDNVVKLLLDLPDLFQVLQEESKTLANFKALEIEGDVKN